MKLRKFNIIKEQIPSEAVPDIWFVSYKNIYLILTNKKIELGDFFVYVSPYNHREVVSSSAMLKYNKVSVFKVLWVYSKQAYDDIVYKAITINY